MNIKSRAQIILASLLASLVGCGGSSSGSDDAITPTVDESIVEENTNTNMELVEKTGVWTGSAEQTNSRWTIEITLSEAEQTVDYPSLNCGGYLTLKTFDETSLLFRETITYGNSNCVDQGLVELIEDGDNNLIYNFYYDDNQTISLGAWGSVQRLP